MTIIPTFRKCKKCGKMYDYNPDVNLTVIKKMCPECIKKELDVANRIIRKKDKDM